MKIPRLMRPTRPVRRKAVERSDPDQPELQDDAVIETEGAEPVPAEKVGLVLYTSKGRPFRLEIMDELFDAVECANKAETHQHRRFHVRRAAKILAESDREFGR